MEMSILTQFIQSSVESGYFSTALLMLVIFGLWRLYKAEQERGRDFGIRFAGEIRQLIETNNNALREIINSIKDLSTRQDLEGKHNLEMRNRLESEFKELYFKRWPVEIKFDIVKNKLELPAFGGFTENVILQDFWISMFLANMVSLAKYEDDKEVKNARLNKDNKYEYQTNINTIIGSLRDKLAEAVFAKIRL